MNQDPGCITMILADGTKYSTPTHTQTCAVRASGVAECDCGFLIPFNPENPTRHARACASRACGDCDCGFSKKPCNCHGVMDHWDTCPQWVMCF